MSKLEQLFEQETLKERDNYDEGADDSTTEFALTRLKSAKEKQPEVLKPHMMERKKLMLKHNKADLLKDISTLLRCNTACSFEILWKTFLVIKTYIRANSRCD